MEQALYFCFGVTYILDTRGISTVYQVYVESDMNEPNSSINQITT